jgi:hypothetical protein
MCRATGLCLTTMNKIWHNTLKTASVNAHLHPAKKIYKGDLLVITMIIVGMLLCYVGSCYSLSESSY